MDIKCQDVACFELIRTLPKFWNVSSMCIEQNGNDRVVQQLRHKFVCYHNKKYDQRIDIPILQFDSKILFESCVVYEERWLVFIANDVLQKVELFRNHNRFSFPLCGCTKLGYNIQLILDGDVVNVFSVYEKKLTLHKFNILVAGSWECQEICRVEEEFIVLKGRYIPKTIKRKKM